MKFLILFGPPAVGKFTVAQKLTEMTNFKLLHNHGDIELLRPIFEFNSDTFNVLSRKIRQSIIEEAAKNGINLIFTYVWNFALPKGKNNIDAYKQIVESNGGEVYFAELYSPLEVRLERAESESRKRHKPHAAKKEVIMELEGSWNMKTGETFFYPDRYLKVDTSNLTADETAEKIKNYFKL